MKTENSAHLQKKENRLWSFEDVGSIARNYVYICASNITVVLKRGT